MKTAGVRDEISMRAEALALAVFTLKLLLDHVSEGTRLQLPRGVLEVGQLHQLIEGIADDAARLRRLCADD